MDTIRYYTLLTLLTLLTLFTLSEQKVGVGDGLVGLDTG